MEIWKPDSIFLDLPHLKIACALRNRDEKALWDAFRQCSDPDLYLDWLSHMAGGHVQIMPRKQGSRRETCWKHNLIASPVLLGATSAPAVPAQDEPHHGTDPLKPELARWAGLQVRTGLVRQVIGYDTICQWSPVYQHFLVRQLAGEPVLPVHATSSIERPRLPAGLPDLRFVVAAIGSWMEWPELPELGTSSSHDFAQRIAASAAYITGRSVPPGSVLAPQLFQHAVLHGVLEWLSTLAASQRFDSWQADPGTPDLVVLQLFHSEDPESLAVIPLRLHQLGPHALGLITRQLWSDIGPCRHAVTPVSPHNLNG